MKTLSTDAGCASPDRLFVYGTLTEPSVFQAVTGLDFQTVEQGDPPEDRIYATPARLDGHAAERLDGRYLYALRRPHASITGWLLHRIPEQAMHRLDEYEGVSYRRKLVTVHSGTTVVNAYVYVSARTPD